MTTAPLALELGLARGGIELRTFFRERDTVFFTFALPLVLLALLGSIFTDTYPGSPITAAQYLAPSMIAAGVASTSFVSVGVSIATDRDNGTLKRLRGVPMPPAAYFVGKVVLVLVTAAAEIALLLAMAVLLFDLPLPAHAAQWITFGWVFLLGVTACSLLGIAASSLAGSARGAASAMNLPYLVLSFISGIFVTPVTVLPGWLVQIGSLFPLKWMAQSFRSVFLPDSMLEYEVVPSWEHRRAALVLVAWCIGGLVLCLTTFRWRGRRDG